MRHNFKASLALSKEQEDAPWWAEIYARAFPGHLSAVSVREDGWAQRGGIDRVVTLKSGKTVTIDEKVRMQDWPDIALERWSDRDRKIPGWVQKDLACDFIAYAFVPSQRCYLLPFLTLRRAWALEGRRWCELAEDEKGGFKLIEADNGNTSLPADIVIGLCWSAVALIVWAALIGLAIALVRNGTRGDREESGLE